MDIAASLKYCVKESTRNGDPIIWGDGPKSKKTLKERLDFNVAQAIEYF